MTTTSSLSNLGHSLDPRLGKALHGTLVALVTPFNPDNTVDLDSLKRLIDFHLENLTSALIILGTTGENVTQTKEERLALVKFILNYVDNRIPIIVGTGNNDTDDSIDFSNKVYDSRISAQLVVVPYYNKPTQEGIFQHYSKIAANTKLPIILYNVPGRTIVDMSNETIARLAQNPAIVAIKEASGDPKRFSQLRQIIPDPTFILLTGDDPTFVDAMEHGCQGIISVANNAYPLEYATIHQLCLHGQYDQARNLFDKFKEFNRLLFVESNPTPIKYVCYRKRLVKHNLFRLPLLPISKELQKLMDQQIDLLG